MAKEKKPETKLKRTYNIPLRKEFLKTARRRRTKKAVIAVKEFLRKHMKSEDVKLGKYLNLKLWEHGMKNPPHHIKVEAVKDDKDIVRAELVGAPKEKELKKPEASKKEDKAKNTKPEPKKADAKSPEKKPADIKQPEPKPVLKAKDVKDPSVDKLTSAAELAKKK